MVGGTLGDIQRQGLRAARDIVDRLVAVVDGVSSGSPSAASPSASSSSAGEAAGAESRGNGTAGTATSAQLAGPDGLGGLDGLDGLDGLVDLWSELAKQMLRAMAGAVSVPPVPSSPLDPPAPDVVEGEGPDEGRSAAETPEVEPPEVEQRLAEAGRAVRRAMLDAIPDGEPHPWLYRLVRSYPSRPGKAIRPALCLATCRAFGGTDADSLPIAVAIELLHNAFLIHDDIADGSRRRRGRPTLAAEFGPALALNAGDALAVVANQVLRRHLRSLSDELADRVFGEFETMALRTLEGQATELGWRQDNVAGLTPEDYLGLIMRKTCWYTTIHPLRVGALVGSRAAADLRPMVRFGFHLGAAFQIRDDLLNLVGDEAVYGKEINGDLYEGKRTLMLIHLLAEARGRDRATVEAYLGMERAERDQATVAEIRRLMDEYGSLAFAAEYAEGISSAALDAFDAAFATARAGPDRDFVRALVPYMLGRRV